MFTTHDLLRLLWQSSPFSGILMQFTYSLTDMCPEAVVTWNLIVALYTEYTEHSLPDELVRLTTELSRDGTPNLLKCVFTDKMQRERERETKSAPLVLMDN